MTRRILTIKAIDEPALIQAPHDRVVDQILGLGGFRLGDGALDIAQHRLDTFFERIGFARLDLLDDHLVTVLRFILIAEPQELFDQADTFLPILFRVGHPFPRNP